MLKSLNITKTYLTNEPIEILVEKLNAIISAPFNDSKYSTFGTISFTKKPPVYHFMLKWYSLGRPMFLISTKLLAKINKAEGKAQISISTRTNPLTIVSIFIFLTFFLLRLSTSTNSQDLLLSGLFLLFGTLTIVFDTFIKNMLVLYFEKDMKVALS